MGKLVDLTGLRFGRLVVLSQAGKAKDGGVMWLCECDCGNEKIIRRSGLVRGSTKSCGCFRREVASRFGEKNPNWKGDKIGVAAGRARASSLFSGEKTCEKCGERAVDIHHKDGNPLNNTLENLEALCRKCHMEEDGRLKALNALERKYMVRGLDGRFLPHHARASKDRESDEDQRQEVKG